MNSFLSANAIHGFSAPDAALVGRFAAIVGEHNALTGTDAAPFLHDERALFQANTPLVLRPASSAEAAAILRLANETRTAIVPQGGRTGLVGGHLPHGEGVEVIVSTDRLARIRAVDPVGRTITCEAGVKLETAQKAAEEHGLLFALNIGAKGSASIGGLLATNAGGTQALHYGTARNLMLGLEVVLPDGRVWNGLRTLRKDNTGYDLRHLFAGSEGTLGLITAAVLKLEPLPTRFETAWLGVADPQKALDVLQLLQTKAGSHVIGCELMPAMLVDFLTRHSAFRNPLSTRTPWAMLVDFGLFGEGESLLMPLLEEAFASQFIDDAVMAGSLAQRETFWAMREQMALVQKQEGGSIKHDVSVPVAALPAFIAEALAALKAMMPDCRPVPFGHMGDGNLHFNVSQPVGMDRAAFLARWEEVNAVVHALVARHGGSIAAEHGIGRLKRNLLPAVKDPVELDMMRAIKAAFDPQGIMNPGKVL